MKEPRFKAFDWIAKEDSTWLFNLWKQASDLTWKISLDAPKRWPGETNPWAASKKKKLRLSDFPKSAWKNNVTSTLSKRPRIMTKRQLSNLVSTFFKNNFNDICRTWTNFGLRVLMLYTFVCPSKSCERQLLRFFN